MIVYGKITGKINKREWIDWVKKESADKLLVSIGILNDDLPESGNKGKKKKKLKQFARANQKSITS